GETGAPSGPGTPTGTAMPGQACALSRPPPRPLSYVALAVIIIACVNRHSCRYDSFAGPAPRARAARPRPAAQPRRAAGAGPAPRGGAWPRIDAGRPEGRPVR